MATTAPPAAPAAASFLENLWSSVFTPGPTPTLLVATNVSFAALQLLLFALLLATYSIHFVILSLLSGGLWWSINWFAQELLAVKRTEAEAESLRRRKRDEDGSGEETEGTAGDQGGVASGGAGQAHTTGIQIRVVGVAGDSPTGDVQQSEIVSRQQKQKKSEAMEQSGDFSTDSEWEAVDLEQS